MVLKQPPPNFFAPYPAATPRSSLLMCSRLEMILDCRGAHIAKTIPLDPLSPEV
jgi:hypothetical protein